MLREEEDKTADLIKNSVKMYEGGDGYDYGVKSTVSKLMMKMVVPWLNQCFNKYSDYDFHLRMQNGFSFVADWKENHHKKYISFLAVSRRLYTMFGIRLDEEYIINTVQQLLAQRGWALYPEEIQVMRRDLQQLKFDIEENS